MNMNPLKQLPVITLLFISSLAHSQLTPEQRIQDSVIGWWDNLQYDRKLAANNDADRKVKIENLDRIVDWMKKSYTPVAGLGTYTRFINTNSYGVQFAVWNVSFDKQWLDKKGHFRPIPEELTKFGVQVNGITGSYPISYINSPGVYLFTWQPDGYGTHDESSKRYSRLDPRIHPNAYKFITHINEAVTVYLAPDNNLPFTPVTRGELLSLAEEAMERQLEKEKKDVETKWPGNLKAQQDAMVYRKATIEKYRTNIGQLRLRYKNSLDEPAVIRDMQPTMYSFQTDPDLFNISAQDRQLKTFYPVYKLTPDVLAKCRTSQPQWIAIWAPYKTNEDGNQLIEMYKAVTENFNFEYVYNYFFNPGKNKNTPYLPSNPEQLKARLDHYRKKSQQSQPVSQLPMASSIYFSDDFSSGTDGSKPAGWYFSTYGKHSIITTLKGKPGKWVKLGYNNALSPVYLKKPLPENFTLEFDLATDAFSSRTGGAVQLHLSSYPLNEDGSENMGKPGNSIDLTIISGNEADYNNNNYMGEIAIAFHSKPALYVDNFNEGLSYKKDLRAFTNKKDLIHLKFVFKDGQPAFFINENKIAGFSDLKMSYGKPCDNCKIPAGTRYNTLQFRNSTNDADNTGIYLGNVKIQL